MAGIARCVLALAALGLTAFAPWWDRGPPFDRSGYYGSQSESAADRAAFAPLIKRFLGRPYREVRPRLIAMGFRPVRIRHTGRPGDPCMLSPRDYPELLACSGVDFAGQSFVFRRPRGGYAIVTTYGEERYKVNTLRAANKGDLEDIRVHAERPHEPQRRSP